MYTLEHYDSICDPDCAFDVDVNCGLDLINITTVKKNSTEVVYKFIVKNFYNQNINNINWTLNTGKSAINSKSKINLSKSEDIFIYINYNYTSIGNYTVVATTFNNQFSETKSLEVKI